MDNQNDVSVLRHWSSPGVSEYKIYDIICDHSAPAAQDCLQVLSIWINLSLFGKVNPWLSPRLAGASSINND